MALTMTSRWQRDTSALDPSTHVRTFDVDGRPFVARCLGEGRSMSVAPVDGSSSSRLVGWGDWSQAEAVARGLVGVG